MGCLSKGTLNFRASPLLFNRRVCQFSMASLSIRKKVDVALNNTIRIITECLKPTPVGKIQILSGVAPSDI